MASQTQTNRFRKDTSVMSMHDMITHQREFIAEWKPLSDVFTLKYGNFVLGAASSICGLSINTYFRRALRLRMLGSGISNLALMVGPALVSATTHHFVVTDKVLLYENSCSMCLEAKAALAQNLSGIGYPLILAPVLNLGIAATNALRVPLWYEVRELAKFFGSVVKPKIPAFTAMFTVQSLLAIAMTHHELWSMDNIQRTILDFEKIINQRDIEHFE